MPRKIRDSVVVITGASSGIGRASALRFARKGATLVLAARREQALRDLASECESYGGRAMVVPTDVTDEQAVQNLARAAIENFGRVDVWVNNAAVSLFSRFEETPPEIYRRVIETNLFGYIYGARAILPYFREQGGGVLINNDSIFGKMGAPYISAYITTKFGIRGLSECLRQELRDAKNIHVCTVMPASIDTPLFQQAANYTGRAIKPLRPIYSADRVAGAIVGLAEHPRREVAVGNAGRMLAMMYRLSPSLGERMMAEQVEKDHFMDAPADPSAGNLFEPMPQYTGVSGGWKAESHGVPVRRLAVAGLAAAIPMTAMFLFRPNLAALLPLGGRLTLNLGRTVLSIAASFLPLAGRIATRR